MKLKRILASLLVVSMVFGMLVGCGNNEGKTSDGEKIEITFGVLNTSSELAIANALKSAFESKNENVRVKITSINDVYNDYVIRMISAKQLPDVLYTLDTKVNYLAEQGVFEPLDDAISGAGINTTDYYESVLNSARPLEDGKLYYVPRDYNRVVTEVNVDMFEAAGLNINDYKDWNWETFKEVCQKLQDYASANKKEDTFKSFIYPIDAQLNWGAVYSPIIESFGGTLFDVKSGNSGFGQEETKAALEEMYSIVQTNYTCTPQDAKSDLFAERKTAMRFATRPNLSTPVKTGVNVDFLPFPSIDSATTGKDDTTAKVGYGSTGYALCNSEYTATKSEEVQKVAQDFVLFIMSKEGQEAMSTTGDIVPMLKSLSEDSEAAWQNWSYENGNIKYTTKGTNQAAFLSSSAEDSYAAYLQGYTGNKQITLYDEYDALMRSFFTDYAGKGSVDGFAEYADDRINAKK